ncbi:growth-regulating factor 9-like isoform X2 [Silene latifolia]|uniref:growth-regulating factor 9-like isoform X2 n=1 Tax=Silene latifolia TaxID=37657 RepID=UPI003D77A6D3
MEKREIKSEPLMKHCLGKSDINKSFYCRSNAISDSNKCQKDSNNVKIEVVDDHDFDHVVENSVGCRNPSVVSITVNQLKQLELQLIIFNYFVWGLPVPLHFLRSLSPSFIHNSWESICNQGTNCRELMEAEPGRCRRTDGKKWRCYQSVVPNEKYCIKHMHRGRKRSRKLVEDVPTNTPTVNEEKPGKNTESSPGFEVAAMHSMESNPRNELSKDAIKAPSYEKVETSNEEKHDIVVKERIAAINLALGLDLSPSENVSQDGRRCSEAELSVKAQRKTLQRCSRTDGRKWQCHNEALPSSKYCAQHHNRGVKKLAFSPSDQKSSGPKQDIMGMGIGMGLDMDLKISLPTNLSDPRPNVRVGATNHCSSSSSSSSSSDPSTETTISDDIAYMSNLVAVSPRIQ